MTAHGDDITRMPVTKCLECGKRLNAIGGMGVSVGPPAPGDPVVCIGCGAVMTFEAGALRGFTDSEMDAIEADPEYMNDLARTVARVHLLRHVVN